MPDENVIKKEEMGGGDYLLAFVLAIFSRAPLANLRVVLHHLWEDFGPGSWFQVEPARYIPVTKKVTIQPGVIYYAHRWGVYVAYMAEDLADLDGEFLMVQPRSGMALFAEHGSHVPKKTGCRRDLQELARQTGRKLELLPQDAFFIPFTSGSTDAELDLRNYGDLILSQNDAMLRWYFPTSPRETPEG